MSGPAVVDLAALLGGPVVPAARGLLGCLVTAGGVTVRLTEVEAYAGVGADPASHAHGGRTARNAVMFGPPGHLYVYFTYGMHWCANVVCGPEGEASAVLLRAGEVVDGLVAARGRRRAAGSDRELARGPARLTQALGIDGSANGGYLLDGRGLVRLAPPAPAAQPASSAVPAGPAVPAEGRIRSGPRVGVAGGHDTPWRFWLAGEPTVSAYRRQTRRR
ncbi:MAG: DNA-3-methyladenine glycosylase [Micromonosporaceae bacterium]|nr:DNA-3-methyladenine glycosylase [Micromonosporaceae bacterium]